MSISKILLPTDFSDCAFNATKYAVQLALNFKSKLLIMTGYQIPMPAADFSVSIDKDMVKVFEQEAQDSYEILKQEIPEMNKCSCEFITEMALAKEAILKVSVREQPDLIVMGTHGRSGIGERILGSITASVIKDSSVPVLAIPQFAHYAPIRKIALGCDFRPIADLNILDRLLELIRAFESELHIIHVSENVGDIDLNEAYEARKIDQYFYGVDHSFHEIADDDISEGLGDFIKSNGIQILAMMPRKHNLFERLFKRSVTEKVAIHSEIPILTLHV